MADKSLQAPAYHTLGYKKGYTMTSPRLIQHPLDRFSLTGSLRDLDCTGRVAADKLMTMIEDMRFPRLCFAAQINSEKLRAYLWLCERGEIEHIFDDAETVVPFLRKRDSQQALNTPKIVKPFAPVAATKKANA
jgi:hypothetical protein